MDQGFNKSIRDNMLRANDGGALREGGWGMDQGLDKAIGGAIILGVKLVMVGHFK